MKRPLPIKLGSALLNVISCLIFVTVLLYIHHWFGKEDLYAVIFWTIPIAIALAICGKELIATLVRAHPMVLRILSMVLIAVVIAYGWVHFVYLFLGSWMHAFSFPILYVWIAGIFCQLIFLDRFDRETKKADLVVLAVFPLTTLLSVAFVYVLSTAFVFITRHEKEIFVIPQNFNGKFRIVYEIKCSHEPPVEEGSRVLEIPDSGLLVIRSHFKTGIVDHEYYFKDNAGKKIRINELLTPAQKDTLSPGVLPQGNGIIAGPMPDGSMSTESALAIHYSDFFVFNSDTTALMSMRVSETDSHLDSMTRNAVENCRATASVYQTAKYRRPIYYFRTR